MIDVIKVPMGTTDFSSYFQRIEDDAPNCLYVFMPGGPMSIGMAKGYAERGWAKNRHELSGRGDERARSAGDRRRLDRPIGGRQLCS